MSLRRTLLSSNRLSGWALALGVITAMLGCGDGSSQGSSAGGTGGSSAGGGSTTSSVTGGAGGSTTSTPTGGTSIGGNNTGGTNTGGNNTGGNNTGGNNTGGNNTGGAGGGLADVGSLVVLGDSISDGGGVAPYYYDLLKADLQAKYGAVEYHHQAQSGSKTDALLTQIGGLPATLTPPVAVVITSGGNDMKAAILQILAGLDESKRTTMGDNLQAALDLLLTPNQFGSGVDVHVFEGNIYDASDGSGKYGMYGCKAPLNLFPAQPTDTYFTNWNAVITDKVSAHGQTLIDMHAEFYGHGFQSDPNWYADDCIHPSQIGHDQLRHLFYKAITGDALP